MTFRGTEEASGFPTGWVLVRVSDVAEVGTGATPNRGVKHYYNGDIPWVTSGAVNERRVTAASEFITQAALDETNAKIFPPGTILIAMYGEGKTRGKAAELAISAATNQALAAVVLSGEAEALRQWILLRLEENYQATRRLSSGGVQPNLNLSHVKGLTVPVPPTRERDRITSLVEQEISRLDAAVDGLKRVQANLKRYRASVLKAAVEGRLVPTEAELARQEGRDYEPASVLLERILKERRRRWEEAELARLKASGKTPKDDKWKSKYCAPAAPRASDLQNLPEGWCWSTLDQLAEVQGGIQKGKARPGSPVLRLVPYLRVANVQRGHLDLSDMREIEATAEEVDALALRRGDVLFNEGGDRDKLGRGWIWSGELPVCIHQNHVFRARPISTSVSSKYLSCYGNSAGQRYFFDEGKQTTNLASLNSTKLRSLPVPLPPEAEQIRIERELDTLSSEIDAIEAGVARDTQRCWRLRQCILSWAFEGKLVDQDPHDEPASVLLERIRAERAAVDADKPPRKAANGPEPAKSAKVRGETPRRKKAKA